MGESINEEHSTDCLDRMRDTEDIREYIVYLETDLSVHATSARQAEEYARRFIQVDALSPLVSIDETRVITSERKRRMSINPTHGRVIVGHTEYYEKEREST